MERVNDLRQQDSLKQAFDHSENVQEVEWYIVFHKAYVTPLWQWVCTLATPREFGHMFMFAQTGPLVQFIEPTHSAVHLELKFDTEDINSPVFAEDYAEAFASIEGWTVVRVRHDPWQKLNVRHLMNFVPSCVTLVKIVLGLPAPCLTPYAYYRFLLRSGKGELIHGRTNIIPKT